MTFSALPVTRKLIPKICINKTIGQIHSWSVNPVMLIKSMRDEFCLENMSSLSDEAHFRFKVSAIILELALALINWVCAQDWFMNDGTHSSIIQIL